MIQFINRNTLLIVLKHEHYFTEDFDIDGRTMENKYMAVTLYYLRRSNKFND